MKTALVTGANGFVGSNLVHELTDNGYFVYALVHNMNDLSSELNDKNVKVVVCPMEAYSDILSIVKDEIDIVFHFAWGGTSGENRANYTLQNDNVRYSCDLINNVNCKRFVYAGSLMEFEFVNSIREEKPISKNTMYNVAKQSARNMLHVIANARGIDYLPLTISNIYGAGEKSERFLVTLLKKIASGQHVPLTKGEQLYDFIYITDAVRAIRLVGEEGKNNKNYYIGNAEQKQLKDYVNEIKEAVNKDANLGFGEVTYSGVLNNYVDLDTKALIDDFEFVPLVSFESGVLKTLEWIKEA